MSDFDDAIASERVAIETQIGEYHVEGKDIPAAFWERWERLSETQNETNGNSSSFNSATSSSAAVTSTSATVLTANASRKDAYLVNTGANPIYLARGTTAADSEGIYIGPNGGVYEINSTNLYTGVIAAIAPDGDSTLTISEGS